MKNDPTSVPALSTEAIAALKAANKIEAIKIVREEKGLGLKEAKDVVEEYLRAHPELQKAIAVKTAKATKTALFWLAAIAALAFYYFQGMP